MAKLFLSYSRDDASLAARLAGWLELEGHEVWWDDDIGGGASFSAEIEKALTGSDAVIVLWSTKSTQSPWVRDEASYGRDQGTLIPLSLDETEAPLGFRQFQTIPVSKWRGKGAPPEAERIRHAIARIAGRDPPANAVGEPAPKPKRFDRAALGIAAAVALLVVIAAGFLIRQHQSEASGISIAVSASPASGDGSVAADYANVAAADLASYLPTRFEGATVIAPADSENRTSAYRILIAAARHSDGVDASVTLSDSNGKNILWSKSWSGSAETSADLRETVSQAVSQAALCLAKARGGAARLEQPALALYISGCTGLFDPDTSEEQLRTTFERIVQLVPDSSLGWTGVAMGRAIYAESQMDRTGRVDVAAVRNARDAIATARKLDPHSGYPYLAEWHLVRADPLRGLDLLDKAIAVDPTEPTLYARLSNSLMSVGRMNDAVEAAHRAVELDPLWSFTRESYINALTYTGQFSRAEADLAEARRTWPNNSEIDRAEFEYRYRYGDARAAEKLLPRVFSYSDAQLLPYRKFIAARLAPTPPNIDVALNAAAAATRADPHQQDLYLVTLASFGKTEEVYGLLGDARFLASLPSDLLFRPEFARVRADPRFIGVAARIGLVRYWRRSGQWPDFCTTEQVPYDCKTEAAKYG